jgi:hypothetical protein
MRTALRRLALPLAPALALPLALLVLPSAAPAHRLDEYLQATLVPIEPGDIRLQINLTPGVAVAEPIVSLIDRDRDGTISAEEGAAYAQSLRRDLTVRLDGRDVDLKLTASTFPPPAEMRGGTGIIQLEYALAPCELGPGAHRLSLENRHMPPVSAYLFNAAQPKSASVGIIRQNRNDNQSVGEIEFTLGAPAHPSRTRGIFASVAAVLVAVFAGVWRARRNSR